MTGRKDVRVQATIVQWQYSRAADDSALHVATTTSEETAKLGIDNDYDRLGRTACMVRNDQ
jgi:hypothetical protein